MGRQTQIAAASVEKMIAAVRRQITGEGAGLAVITLIENLVDEAGAVASIKVPGYSEAVYATVCPEGKSAQIHVPRWAKDGLVVP